MQIKIPLVGCNAKQTLSVSFKFRMRLGNFLRKKRGNMTFVEFERKMGIPFHPYNESRPVSRT